jgi:hypothetical protein
MIAPIGMLDLSSTLSLTHNIKVLLMLNQSFGMGTKLVNLIGWPWHMASVGLGCKLAWSQNCSNLACSLVHK